MVQSIPDNKKRLVISLYHKEKLSLKEISDRLGVSLDASTFFFRKHKIKKRTQREAQYEKFMRRDASFTKNKINTKRLKELAIIGSMLYWGEGYKGNVKNPANVVDFANSDYKMIVLFLCYLREVFKIDEKKFRIYIYCYSNQNIKKLTKFWSKITNIPENQFTRPYIREDYNKNSNTMINGLIHIRYHDKKLLLEIKSMIESYVLKYAPIV